MIALQMGDLKKEQGRVVKRHSPRDTGSGKTRGVKLTE
jgi:hypothetical protein